MHEAENIASDLFNEYKFGPNRVFTMSETILSLSEFKADPSRLLDNIRVEPTTLVLTQNGRARAVVEDYEQHQERQRAHFIDVQPRLNVVWHCYAGTADPDDNHAV